jgi:predicted outer membrane repeat protein
LALSDCTLTGNQAEDGGAIFSETAPSGGGKVTEIRRCTFTGNTASRGGAIFNEFGLTSVLFSTISGNSVSGSDGGGIASKGSLGTETAVISSIISRNTGGDVVFFSGTTNSFTSQGRNLIGDGNATGAFTAALGDIVGVTDPLLAPLDNYGGPTKTMALRPGSPARNVSYDRGGAFDQRGFAIFGTPDIGAYEAGTLTNYNAFIWETLPATATVAQHAATFDFDGDGATNGDEYIAGTVVTNPASVFRVTGLTRSGNLLSITFPSVLGRNYALEYSTTLEPDSWLGISGTDRAGTGSPLTISLTVGGAFPQFFVRPRATSP